MKPIVVIGSANTDLVARTPRLPRPGETVLGADLLTLPGGKGANQAVAAARLRSPQASRLLAPHPSHPNATVHLIARVGDDAPGAALRANLDQNNVDVTHVRPTPGVPSGTALILVDAAGENCIAVCPGANGRVSPADVDAAEDLIARASVVLLQLEIPPETVLHAIALCRRLGVPSVLDPAPVPAAGLPPAMYAVDVLTPNETEAARLAGADATGPTDPEAIARAIARRGPGHVVMKLGAAGALIVPADGPSTAVPPFPVEAVDSTAAGDAFNGALAVALSEGRPLNEAVRFANAAGALCCTKAGAQPSLPTRDEVERLLVP